MAKKQRFRWFGQFRVLLIVAMARLAATVGRVEQGGIVAGVRRGLLILSTPCPNP
jgi:hypothetical protein